MTSWRDETFVGFDTETSGKYPLEAEICEIAAVKWRGGEIVDEFQTLVRTSRPMGAEVIAIHNITNEMLAGAPKIGEAIANFHAFVGDAYMVAHHAPFDMGFIAPEFERARLALPKNPAFCSSLLSRKAFPVSAETAAARAAAKLARTTSPGAPGFKNYEMRPAEGASNVSSAAGSANVLPTAGDAPAETSAKTGGAPANHKLQTLIKYFDLQQGAAHRALDDARACLAVGMKVFEKVGVAATIDDLLTYQEAKLPWTDYSIAPMRAHPVQSVILKALEVRQPVQIVYSGGSRPGQPRTVQPMGVVRNPLDDYLVALEEGEEIPKRYFLNKITAARL